MTPQQIADAIIRSRYPLMAESAAIWVNMRTAIVDGIERALAERGPVTIDNPEDHLDRMRVARRVAEWHIGDADWAPLIVGAYLNPESALQALDEDQEDQHHALGLD